MALTLGKRSNDQVANAQLDGIAVKTYQISPSVLLEHTYQFPRTIHLCLFGHHPRLASRVK